MELGPVLVVTHFLLHAASAQFQYPMTYGQQARGNPLDFVVELSHIPLPVSPFKLDSFLFQAYGVLQFTKAFHDDAATTPLLDVGWGGAQE